VAKRDKTLNKILHGASDGNIVFAELCQLLVQVGFDERIRGSHHIFTKADVLEILNLQPKGSKAKPYQVKQVRNIIIKYKMAGDEDDTV
jgi:predicted RNA binding protein YcfA (HicA-like mRNA interferase family)